MDAQVVVFNSGYRSWVSDRGLGPLAFWPVGSQPCIVRLFVSLANEGVERVLIYCDRLHPLRLDGLATPDGLQVRAVVDQDISGTAGMLRLAVDSEVPGPIVILPVNMVDPPEVWTLLDLHRQGGADLTLFADPHSGGDILEIYVCSPEVLSHIPPQGYWDIKERL
ncbi:MAG: hypothetical protein QHH07_11980, partial [Sedimentisphaerales bacterium]|nr:hypothetical protein [Sedimentisphaerales bacterium]